MNNHSLSFEGLLYEAQSGYLSAGHADFDCIVYWGVTYMHEELIKTDPQAGHFLRRSMTRFQKVLHTRSTL